MKKLSFSSQKSLPAENESINSIPSEPSVDNKTTIQKQNRRDEDGPPDLDEVFGKFKEAFMNKKKSTGSSDDDGGGSSFNSQSMGFSPKIITYVLIFAFAIWLASGFYIVNPAERGVVLRLGDYVRTTMPGPNWHLPYPISEAYIVDVDQIRNVEIGYRTARNMTASQSSVSSESLMLTIDENIVDVKLAVQYRVSNAENYLFNVRDPDLTLTQAVESAIRETVGKSTLNFVLTNGRDQVAIDTRDLSQQILDRYQTGITITTINLQDVQPPEQVQDAFNDAVRAREDQQKLINEAEAYSNDIIPKARGSAARMVQEAEAYSSQVTAIANGEATRFVSVFDAYKESPEVTKKRLFIETMQEVLQNTPKVVVDSDNAAVVNLLGSGAGAAMNSIFTDDSNTSSSSSSSTATPNLRGSSTNNSGLNRLQRAMQRITGNSQ